MKSIVKMLVGLTLVGAMPIATVWAEEGMKTLPTLLIKGEVVSLNASDPAATLLTVKDRYGFETPIYLTPETKIAQGEATVAASSLVANTAVEVEYNFDVNTAKRHAVSVKVGTAATPAAAPSTSEAPVVQAPATPEPVAPPTVTPEASKASTQVTPPAQAQ